LQRFKDVLFSTSKRNPVGIHCMRVGAGG
jgi:hypothetical protein